MLIGSKRTLAIVLSIILCGIILGVSIGAFAQPTASANAPTIVIDAGHGGIDAGVYGVNTGVKESDLNLAIAKELRGRFIDAGFNCVMTRTTQAGLYGSTAKGFKTRDMQKRKEIIENSGADMVISIHQNTYEMAYRRGSHVFYNIGSADSKELAGYIQSFLNGLSGGVERNTTLAGDYYILKCVDAPSVIVECGFLSNAEDEKLLTDADYRAEIALAIFKGCIMYFS